jgi:hypothetical protein
MSASGRLMDFTIRGVREIRTSVRLRCSLGLMKSRPTTGISLRKGILLFATDASSW